MRFSVIVLLAIALRAQPVSLTYLGTAGWQITNGNMLPVESIEAFWNARS
ncbi:MAG: hypothetical protein ABSE86_10565 [Bryobacteraceae bacterium]